MREITYKFILENKKRESYKLFLPNKSYFIGIYMVRQSQFLHVACLKRTDL